MPTLQQQIQSKVDNLEIGTLVHLHDLFVTNIGDGISARSIWNDPRIYKSIFSLDKLGIEKSLKSVILEVRDSIARVYYILDSSCFFIDFQCDYQTLEVTKELPTEVIHYLKILCGKKGRLEIIVREDTIYLLFEDTFPSKMTAKEKKEKEVDIYVLSIPLKEVDDLDMVVIDFVKEVVQLDDTSPSSHENFDSPIDLSTISINKEPIEYWRSIVTTSKGDFTIVDTSGINATLVICPVERSIYQGTMTMQEVEELSIEDLEADELIPDDVKASKLRIKRAVEDAKRETLEKVAVKKGITLEEAAKYIDSCMEGIEELDFSYNYEEDMEDLNDAAELVDSFMTDDGLFQENNEYLQMMDDIWEGVDE